MLELSDNKKLNSIELTLRYAALQDSLDLLSDESKELVLAELKDCIAKRSEKIDGIHHAMVSHKADIERWKEERALIDEQIKHHESQLKGLRGLLQRLHDVGACDDKNYLNGKNYQFLISRRKDPTVEIVMPIEEWNTEHQEEYAMVQEVTTTTRYLKAGTEVRKDQRTKTTLVPDKDAIKTAHQGGRVLPACVKVQKSYIIKTKRILSK